MKKSIKEFLKRGLMCCWGGPLILSIVWLCISGNNISNEINLYDASISIITVTILAFVVAGISAIYQIENIPIVMAGLIQFIVIYFAYLIVYLINGWLDTSIIWIYTLIFVLTFIVIWIIIYNFVKRNVNKINSHIQKN